MEVHGSIDIAAPPEKVWRYLTELEKIQQRFSSVEEVRYTGDRRDCVGATFFMRERVGDECYHFYFVVTEWIENRVLAFRMTAGHFFKAYEQRWTIDPIPYGSRFSFHDRIEFQGGFFGRLIGWSMRRRSTATGEAMLTRFKTLAEGS
jgi:uncharacterized protein YndB with AHSA1/START domain